jgi:macrodomain Ter protein organizer (MatP/YcbG family)
MTEHISPKELIKIRAEAAEKRKRHWSKVSDEELKKSIDLSLFNHHEETTQQKG